MSRLSLKKFWAFNSTGTFNTVKWSRPILMLVDMIIGCWTTTRLYLLLLYGFKTSSLRSLPKFEQYGPEKWLAVRYYFSWVAIALCCMQLCSWCSSSPDIWRLWGLSASCLWMRTDWLLSTFSCRDLGFTVLVFSIIADVATKCMPFSFLAK